MPESSIVLPISDALLEAIKGTVRISGPQCLIKRRHLLGIFARLEEAEIRNERYDDLLKRICPICNYVTSRDHPLVERPDAPMCCEVCFVANASEEEVAEYKRTIGMVAEVAS